MKNVFLTTAVFTLSLALTGAEVRLLADRSEPGPVTGIAVQEGRIFASGGLGEPLQELDGTGAVRRAWGRKFIADKHGLRSSGGYLYATDIGNHQVFKMTPDGEVVMTLGEKGVPGCDETHFNKPTDVAVAPDGDIYVTDGYGNRRVACFGPDGRFKFAWGKEGSGPGEFKNPHNIVIGSDNRFLIPASALFGGIMVVGCDTVGRMAMDPSELPVGVIMSLLGPPFFLWLLRRHSYEA